MEQLCVLPTPTQNSNSVGWGIPFVPAPEHNGEAKGAARLRYVVQHVEQDAPLSSAQETVWRVRLRPHAAVREPASSALFVLLLGQAPDRAAPYDVGTTLEIDPRLLAQD